MPDSVVARSSGRGAKPWCYHSYILYPYLSFVCMWRSEQGDRHVKPIIASRSDISAPRITTRIPPVQRNLKARLSQTFSKLCNTSLDVPPPGSCQVAPAIEDALLTSARVWRAGKALVIVMSDYDDDDDDADDHCRCRCLPCALPDAAKVLAFSSCARPRPAFNPN